MRKVQPGDVCENGDCQHQASGIWVGEGGALAITRDYMQQLWCGCCMLEVQIAHAEKRAAALEEMRADLAAMECKAVSE